jgi:hypothetical protein
MSDLRLAWTKQIEPDDYEAHMKAVGQAQANADLLAELFRDFPPAAGARVHIAGAGTGQYFDYWPVAALAPYELVFTDLNPQFLVLLTARTQELTRLIRVEDIEAPRLIGPWDLTIVILVLEHVDWGPAVSALCARTERAFVVIQENPPDPPPRELVGTMDVLREARPHLIAREALIDAFQLEGFELARISMREVLDAKHITGLDFTRRQ